MPEEEFYGMIKICDEFEIVLLEESFRQEVASRLEKHPLIKPEDIKRLGKSASLEQIKVKLNEGQALPIYIKGDQLVGCVQSAHEEDASLVADILIENLAARASGVMVLRHLIAKTGKAEEIDYLLGYGEEAVGDRYNRGGGSLSKAIGELCGCTRATGSDVKAFCCAPVHALILAGGLVASKLFENVVLVAGGSFAKLGMKFQGHLRHDMPILEDVLAAIAIWVTQDDGKSPVMRLDSIGKQEISSGSAQQAILEKLVIEPLDRLGIKLTEINKYATELHNPEVTEPQGSGNVPRTNYRTIGSFAVLRNEIQRNELDRFVEVYAMPGFSPTQGHIAYTATQIGRRESRRVLGGYYLTADKDMKQGLKHEDVVVKCRVSTNRDISLLTPELAPLWDIPYRCLVPRVIDGLPVAGRCISIDHKAATLRSPRDIATCISLGEAAGTAAALSIKSKVKPRDLDVRLLQDTQKKQGANLEIV